MIISFNLIVTETESLEILSSAILKEKDILKSKCDEYSLAYPKVLSENSSSSNLFSNLSPNNNDRVTALRHFNTTSYGLNSSLWLYHWIYSLRNDRNMSHNNEENFPIILTSLANNNNSFYLENKSKFISYLFSCKSFLKTNFRQYILDDLPTQPPEISLEELKLYKECVEIGDNLLLNFSIEKILELNKIMKKYANEEISSDQFLLLLSSSFPLSFPLFYELISYLNLSKTSPLLASFYSKMNRYNKIGSRLNSSLSSIIYDSNLYGKTPLSLNNSLFSTSSLFSSATASSTPGSSSMFDSLTETMKGAQKARKIKLGSSHILEASLHIVPKDNFKGVSEVHELPYPKIVEDLLTNNEELNKNEKGEPNNTDTESNSAISPTLFNTIPDSFTSKYLLKKYSSNLDQSNPAGEKIMENDDELLYASKDFLQRGKVDNKEQREIILDSYELGLNYFDDLIKVKNPSTNNATTEKLIPEFYKEFASSENKIFLTNLPLITTEETLEKSFAKIGKIKHIKMINPDIIEENLLGSETQITTSLQEDIEDPEENEDELSSSLPTTSSTPSSSEEMNKEDTVNNFLSRLFNENNTIFSRLNQIENAKLKNYLYNLFIKKSLDELLGSISLNEVLNDLDKVVSFDHEEEKNILKELIRLVLDSNQDLSDELKEKISNSTSLNELQEIVSNNSSLSLNFFNLLNPNNNSQLKQNIIFHIQTIRHEINYLISKLLKKKNTPTSSSTSSSNSNFKVNRLNKKNFNFETLKYKNYSSAKSCFITFENKNDYFKSLSPNFSIFGLIIDKQSIRITPAENYKTLYLGTSGNFSSEEFINYLLYLFDGYYDIFSYNNSLVPSLSSSLSSSKPVSVELDDEVDAKQKKYNPIFYKLTFSSHESAWIVYNILSQSLHQDHPIFSLSWTRTSKYKILKKNVKNLVEKKKITKEIKQNTYLKSESTSTPSTPYRSNYVAPRGISPTYGIPSASKDGELLHEALLKEEEMELEREIKEQEKIEESKVDESELINFFTPSSENSIEEIKLLEELIQEIDEKKN